MKPLGEKRLQANRKIRFLRSFVSFLLAAILTIGFVGPGRARDHLPLEQDTDSSDVEMVKNRNGIPSARYELCRDLYALLKRPENQEFLDASPDDRENFTIFKVPEGTAKFQLPQWEKVTEDEFEEALPEYWYRVEYARKRGDEPKNFRKTILDGLNNGKKVPMYAVDFSPSFTETLMTDNDGRGRWWNDENEGGELFLYKGRVFLAQHGHSDNREYPDGLSLRESVTSPKIGSRLVCSYRIYRTDDQRRARDAQIADAAVRKFFKTPKGKGEDQFRGWAVVDLNGDGKTEIVLVWTPMTPTNRHSNLTVFSHESGEYKPVATVALKREARLSTVKDGVILVDQRTYAPGDPVCCPSVKHETAYRWAESKLSPVK